MVAFILPANSASSGGYEIDNSLRFNDDDLHYLERTFDSSGSQRTFTISAWVKRSELSTGNNTVWGAAPSNGGQLSLQFNSSDQLILREYNTSDAEVLNLVTSGLFRDSSAWYHIVAAVDTTDGTASNRAKLYVNGAQPALGTATYPNQNYDLLMNNTTNTGKFFVGNETYSSTSAVFDGYIAEFYIINNSQLAPTSFGETDDNGVWIPKDASGDLTFGTNGFYLEFKQTGTGTDASGMGADTSGEDHHFAIANNGSAFAATDVTTDTPTNNFCTFNPLDVNVGMVPTFAEGNTKFTVNGSANSGNNHSRTDATIRPSSGKWYAEFTFLSGYSTADGTTQVGIISGNAGRNSVNNDGHDQDNGNDSEAIGYRSNGSVVNNSGTQILDGLTTFTTDDIMGIALDLDNDKFFVSKNGTFFTNGTGTQDPPNGTNPLFSGGVITSHKVHGFNIGAKGYSSAANVIAANFGNPHTSISSGNADGAGYGNFEYAVPSGYYSLCTKNLATYG